MKKNKLDIIKKYFYIFGMWLLFAQIISWLFAIFLYFWKFEFNYNYKLFYILYFIIWFIIYFYKVIAINLKNFLISLFIVVFNFSILLFHSIFSVFITAKKLFEEDMWEKVSYITYFKNLFDTFSFKDVFFNVLSITAIITFILLITLWYFIIKKAKKD